MSRALAPANLSLPKSAIRSSPFRSLRTQLYEDWWHRPKNGWVQASATIKPACAEPWKLNRSGQPASEAGNVEFMPCMEGTILHAILAPSKKQEQAPPKPKPAAPPAEASAPAPPAQ